jgi:hypothetical protein
MAFSVKALALTVATLLGFCHLIEEVQSGQRFENIYRQKEVVNPSVNSTVVW